MNQKQSWEEKVHLKLLEKSESAKDCGEMTVVKIGFLPSIIKEIVDEAIQTREREISEEVGKKSSNGVVDSHAWIFVKEVLSIINNK